LKQWRRIWGNVKNDALGLFNHLTNAMPMTYPERAVFAMEDKNFRKHRRLTALQQCRFPGEILQALESVAFICQVLGVSLPV
jgi:hypothetical protein